MSQERACPRRPSAPPGEMLRGTRSHFTCITSNRMIRVMVAMLTRRMIYIYIYQRERQVLIVTAGCFLLFLFPLACTNAQCGNPTMVWPLTCIRNLRPSWRRITRHRFKNDFRNLGMACSVGHWRRRQTQGVGFVTFCRRNFCICACDSVGLLL